jgi:predicted Zn-dependent peptidase
MKYSLTKLASGLRVLTVAMPQLESATLTVWVKTGSRMEEARTNGISHFLEHMVFKGGKKRPSAKEIAEAVDAIGGEFNAATSKDWTNFYIKARSAHLEKAFDVLSDMVLSPILDAKEIEKEKGVIVEELKMYEDTPMIKIHDVFEELVFSGNSLAWDIGGSEKTVRSLKRNDFIRYRKVHYYAENTLLTVVGGINQQKVLALARKYFQSLGQSSSKKIRQELFKTQQSKPRVKLHPKKKEQAHFVLGFLGDGRGHPQRFAQSVLTSILGGGMSSRLFTEVRERRGLAYAVRTSPERYSETGYISTYVGADVKRVEEAIKVTLDEHYKLASGKSTISKKEFEKAKEYLKGHLALALEDTKDVSGFFGEPELFLEEALTPEEVLKRLDKVKINEVMAEARRLFTPARLNLAIIGPYESPERFQKLLK